MARETINGISVPIPGTGEPADFQGDLRRFATDLPASTGAQINDLAARKTLVPAARLRTWGHSIMHGSTTGTAGAVIGSTDMATLISNGLGLPLDQQAIAGASLYNHASAADWASIMQYETRGTRYAALGGAYALMYGINDMAYLGLTETALLPFKHALRTAIARLRCAAVFEDDHASVTYGGSGTWIAATGTASNSGAGWRYNATSGGTITITTPANFPGGTIDLGFVAWHDGSTGVITGPAPLGSPALDMGEFAASGDGRRTGVLRVQNVPARAGTYVFTTSAVSGPVGVVFDWWGWEAPEDASPIVAVVNQAKPLDYNSQAGATYPGTDAGVDALNATQLAVVNEFGARVLYVNTSAIDKDPAYWESGNIHPNAAGHAYIADQTLAAIETLKPQFVQADLLPTTAASSSGGAGGAWTNYTPTLAGITLGDGTLLAAYRDNGAETIDFYIRIILGSTSSVTGAVTATLPANAAVAYSKIAFDVMFEDSGSGYYGGKGLLLALDKVTVRSLGASGAAVNLSGTAPFTWATGDKLDISGRYRRA